MASKFRRDLIRSYRYVHGGLFPRVYEPAAQVNVESNWNSGICSKYACGLSQFTPGTVTTMRKLHPKELGDFDYLNPRQSLLALVIYMNDIYHRIKDVSNGTERRAMALVGYNGGEGNLRKERRLAADRGLDSNVWSDNVELACIRRSDFCKESREYPHKVMFKWEPIYEAAGW